MIESATGDPLGPLPHYLKHSPSGFSWGYEGSGPAELARCIVIAILGMAARCPTCAGTGRVIVGLSGAETPFDPNRDDLDAAANCWQCDAGVAVSPALYQRFKAAAVAEWPSDAEFRITAGDVRVWLVVVGEGTDSNPPAVS
jgi:hypothetical protein